MIKETNKEFRQIPNIKNEITENLKFYNVEVISSNLNMGWEIYKKWARLKVSDLKGLEHFVKII